MTVQDFTQHSAMNTVAAMAKCNQNIWDSIEERFVELWQQEECLMMSGHCSKEVEYELQLPAVQLADWHANTFIFIYFF